MLMIKLANCFYNIAILYRIIYMDFSTNLKGFYQMLVLYCLRTVKNLMPPQKMGFFVSAGSEEFRVLVEAGSGWFEHD